jgi:hypothetical protein
MLTVNWTRGVAQVAVAAIGFCSLGFLGNERAVTQRQALAGSRVGVEYAGAGTPQQQGGLAGAAAQKTRDAAKADAVPRRAERGMPRTPSGKPDFQGTWLNNTATPLERPKNLGDRAYFTEAEAAEWEKTYQITILRNNAASQNVDPTFHVEATGIEIDTFEPGPLLPGRRSSLIVDPPDGRLPALTPAGQRRLADLRERTVIHHTDNPENQTNSERCLATANTAVPPLMPNLYNNHLQIVQTGAYVIFLSEMVHDARVIPLNGRPHLPPTIRQWKGDPVGRWEGDVLVVDTTNFNGEVSFRGAGPNMHLTERFSFAEPNTISYRFTVDDPESFTRAFTAQSMLGRADDQMFEYACHEGNYSIVAILRGGRAADKR